MHEAARVARDEDVGLRGADVRRASGRPSPPRCAGTPRRTCRRSRSTARPPRTRPGARPSIEPSSSATASLLAVPRVWHERCRATAEFEPARPGPDAEAVHDEVAQLPRAPAEALDLAEVGLVLEFKQRRRGRASPRRSPRGRRPDRPPEKVRTVCRTTLRDAAQSPPLNAGWPQHVWPSGNATSQPRCSSTSTVAAATSSWNASHRHVAISWTRLPATGSAAGSVHRRDAARPLVGTGGRHGLG